MNKEESDLIIAEQNKSTEEILKAFAKVKSDYHELCKLKDMRIAKLGEENKVLAQNLEDTEILNKTYEKRFDDLEKENAELKLKLEALEEQTPWKDIKDKSELIGQLATAKEIISEYMNILKGDTKSWKKTQEKAEQFLKDCEVEK